MVMLFKEMFEKNRKTLLNVISFDMRDEICVYAIYNERV